MQNDFVDGSICGGVPRGRLSNLEVPIPNTPHAIANDASECQSHLLSLAGYRPCPHAPCRRRIEAPYAWRGALQLRAALIVTATLAHDTASGPIFQRVRRRMTAEVMVRQIHNHEKAITAFMLNSPSSNQRLRYMSVGKAHAYRWSSKANRDVRRHPGGEAIRLSRHLLLSQNALTFAFHQLDDTINSTHLKLFVSAFRPAHINGCEMGFRAKPKVQPKIVRTVVA
jgi:hypothetical protein